MCLSFLAEQNLFVSHEAEMLSSFWLDNKVKLCHKVSPQKDLGALPMLQLYTPKKIPKGPLRAKPASWEPVAPSSIKSQWACA